MLRWQHVLIGSLLFHNLLPLAGRNILRDEQAGGGWEALRVLVGVLTVAEATDRRSLLRMLYHAQLNSSKHVRVVFVLGRPRQPLWEHWLALEQTEYKDILLLDLEENMDGGKTHAYFRAAAGMQEITHITKLDDDSFLHLPNFLSALALLPAERLYYGFEMESGTSNSSKAMAGMGYTLSFDLVQWIATEIPADKSLTCERCGEDMQTAHWLKHSGLHINLVSDRQRFYDAPYGLSEGGEWSHEYTPDTVLVHQLKKPKQWAHLLAYFYPQGLFIGHHSLRQQPVV